jgi:hypothetical protein
LIQEISPCEKFNNLKELNSIDFTGNKCINTIIYFNVENLKDFLKKGPLSVCYGHWFFNRILPKQTNVKDKSKTEL